MKNMIANIFFLVCLLSSMTAGGRQAEEYQASSNMSSQAMTDNRGRSRSEQYPFHYLPSYFNNQGNRNSGNKSQRHHRGAGMSMGSSRKQPARQRWSQQYRAPFQPPHQLRQQPFLQPRQQALQPPKIEVSVSDITPFEQQSLLYKIRVTSSGNLKTISPDIPHSGMLVLRQIGDPYTETVQAGGRTEFIMEFRYLLMPLASGVMEIPPPKIHGKYVTGEGDEGSSYELTARHSIKMYVRPAADAVQPWLPLSDLKITAEIEDGTVAKVGKPITLEVKLAVIGATGAQIPSIASHLSSEDFRLYSGKTVTQGHITPDGNDLQGSRVERFTLVPQYGGWLEIPTMQVNWWNIRRNRLEVTSLHLPRLRVIGPTNPHNKANPGLHNVSNLMAEGPLRPWLPIIVALLAALLISWTYALFGSGRLPGLYPLKKLLKWVLGELYAPIASFGARISPRRHFHRLRTWTGRNLPTSWKLWFCLRAVAQENDPTEWGQALQILAAKHLEVRPNTHLRLLGTSIAAYHPHADAQVIDRLMCELDGAAYGDQPIQSFSRWKREFESQIKPGLIPTRFRRNKATLARSGALPELNPE